MQTSSFSSLTVGEVLASLRDVAFVAGIAVVGWHARAGYQMISDFLNRVTSHMTAMETFAQSVVNNHLRHIEVDLKTLSGRQHDLPPLG